jgi:hypothetical protein
MKTTRLLLPFTHGVDMEALEVAVLLAKSHEATLIPLALVHVPDQRRSTGARLEHIQQAKDFLEAAQHKAMRHNVSIERFEVFTSDAAQSTDVLVQQLECDGILLFARGSDSMLLSTDEARRLREKIACMCYIVRLPAKRRAGVLQLLREYLPGWITGQWKRAEELVSLQALAESTEQPPGRTRKTEPPMVGTRLIAFASELHPTWVQPGGGRDQSGPYGVSAEEKGAML